MKNTSERICHIAGIGAVGGLIAGYLAHAGIATRLIFKNNLALDVYEQTGLEIISKHERFCVKPPAGVLHLMQEAINWLFVSVKAFDVTSLLLALQKHFTKNTIIILLHNGLGVLEEIDRVLPNLRIISGVSTLGVHKLQTFKIQAFLDGNMYFGVARGQLSAAEIADFCLILENSKLPYAWDDNIFFRLWEKFAINCSINLLTVLFNCKNIELLQQQELLTALTQEITNVLKAHKVNINYIDLLQTVKKVIVDTGGNFSSMQQDVQNRRPTELKYLNEYLVALGEQNNIPTPINNDLLEQYRMMY
jgi:2-dehydropantoate 2-reductase